MTNGNTDFNRLDGVNLVSFTGIRKKKKSGECRARSDCTYVQADLNLHIPQNKCSDSNGSRRIKTSKFRYNDRISLPVGQDFIPKDSKNVIFLTARSDKMLM